MSRSTRLWIGASLLLTLIFAPSLLSMNGPTQAHGQGTPQALLTCEPLQRQTRDEPPDAASPSPPTAISEEPAERIQLSVGFVPISIYAPVFLAYEKGYYDAQGLDVTLEPLAGGADLVALTASGQLQATAAGAGPAFWNAAAQGLPLSLIAPGHAEGVPVATPLMISKRNCESGAITSVADLRGKRVAVNAPGATEYWLAQALSTGGLTLDDIDFQTLPFPDAVIALDTGALDASMIGEPLATKAEQEGIAVRLSSDFPVQGVQPTAILANSEFGSDNPEAMTGFVVAYMHATRDLANGGFTDPENLAIIEQYTGVPAELISRAVPPVYAVNGEIDVDGLNALQIFFRDRGQLVYDENIDPEAVIDRQFVEAALAALGPASAE